MSSSSKIPIEELKKDIVLKPTLLGEEFVFNTTWGLFSPERIDEGTELLLNSLEIKPGDAVLDLGCGYGALGVAVAKKFMPHEVHMIDKDFVAVEYAKKNAALNGVSHIKTYLSNGFDQVSRETKFDVIVSNLPAKVSKEFFWILFEEARRALKPGGHFYVVTIAGLGRFTEKNMNIIFGNYELLKAKGTYFVARARRT